MCFEHKRGTEKGDREGEESLSVIMQNAESEQEENETKF